MFGEGKSFWIIFMAQQIYLNGLFLDEKKAQISVTNRALWSGEGLFETLRVYQGYIAFLEEHLERLWQGAEFLKLKIPVSSQRLQFLIQETLKLNGLSQAVVRIHLSPEGEEIGEWDSVVKRVNLLISCKPFHPYSENFYESGVECVVADLVRAEQGPLAQVKSSSYLRNVMARRFAKANNALEALILNGQGRVAELSGGNLFWVEDEKVFTPPASEGILLGVTRQRVIELLNKEGLSFAEKELTLENLKQAQEVFLTSSLKEIMPIREIKGIQAWGINFPVTQRILLRYREELQWKVEEYLSDKVSIPD